jgi:hypothetical protein
LDSKCPYFWRLDKIFGAKPVRRHFLAELSPPSRSGSEQSAQNSDSDDSDDDDDNNDDENEPEERHDNRRGKSKRRGSTSAQNFIRDDGTGRMKGLKRMLQANEARKEARDRKRLKSEAEVQRYRIDAETRVAEIQARSNEKVAEIQARSNEKLAEMQQETMRMQMRMMEGIFHMIHRQDAPGHAHTHAFIPVQPR